MGIALRIGGITIAGKSVQPYWTPQRIADTFLFYASDPTNILNKVVSTQLPNQVTGAVDYLTVTGSGLNARYRTPDNATYRTADADYVFWKTDASESTCDGNRLIAYDFPRILVKYLNVAPYTILWIAILKPATVVNNQMRDAFDLSVWWDNTLSAYGNVKENRGIGKSVWTPESVISLGEELITNGTFDDATDWFVTAGVWAISGGKANYISTTTYGMVYKPHANVNLENGKTYQLKYTISGSGGAAKFFPSNNSGQQIFTEYDGYKDRANGSYTETVTCMRTSYGVYSFGIYATNAGGTYSLDDLSIKEIL